MNAKYPAFSNHPVAAVSECYGVIFLPWSSQKLNYILRIWLNC